MGIKRIVDVQFWNDDKVLEMFSPEDKLFMLYLMTNPHTTQLGIYAINVKHMAFELGYSLDTIKILLDRFEEKYDMIKYSYDAKEIAIKNYLKHSIIKGGKPVEDCLMKEISQVKDKSLLCYVYRNIYNCESLNETVKKLLPILNEYDNEKQNDNDNDNDNEVSYHDTINDTIVVSNKKISIEQEFDDVWKEYPRKQGKAAALKAYIKSRKKGIEYQTILNGIYTYQNYIDVEKIESQYIKQGSTWFNQECWNDDYIIKRKPTTKNINIDISDF